MTEFDFSFDSKTKTLNENKLKEPKVFFDTTEWNKLFNEIDEFESKNKLNETKQEEKEERIITRYYLNELEKVDSKDLTIQRLIADKLTGQGMYVADPNIPDDAYEIFETPFLYDYENSQPKQTVNKEDFDALKTEYQNVYKSEYKIEINRPPGRIANLISAGTGAAIGGGFFYQFILNSDSIKTIFGEEISKYVANNSFSIAMNCVTFAVQTTKDIQLVLKGDSWTRIPRNFLSNTTSLGLGIGSYYLLALIPTPVGFLPWIGFMILKVGIDLGTNKIKEFIVEKIIYKSDVERQWQIASELANQELEKQKRYNDFLNEIRNDKIYSSNKVLMFAWNGFSLLDKPWKWTKGNWTSVLYAGIGYSFYKGFSNGSYLGQIGENYLNNFLASTFIKLLYSVPIADYINRILSAITNKLKLRNIVPGRIKSIISKIENIIGREIRLIVLISVFVEYIIKYIGSQKIAKNFTINNLENLGEYTSPKTITNAWAFWEQVKSNPLNITLFYEYLNQFPIYHKPKETLYIETDGKFNPYAIWNEEGNTYTINGQAVNFNDIKKEENIFEMNKNGVLKQVLFAPETFDEKTLNIFDEAIQNGYPQEKIDQFIDNIDKEFKKIENARKEANEQWNLRQKELEESTKDIQTLKQQSDFLAKEVSELYFQNQDNSNQEYFKKLKSRALLILNDTNDPNNPNNIEIQNLINNAKSYQDVLNVLKRFDTKLINLEQKVIDNRIQQEGYYNEANEILNKNEQILREFVSKKMNEIDKFIEESKTSIIFGGGNPIITNIDSKQEFSEFKQINGPKTTASGNLLNAMSETKDNIKVESKEINEAPAQKEEAKSDVKYDNKTDFIKNIETHQSLLDYEIKNASSYELKQELENILASLNKFAQMFGGNAGKQLNKQDNAEFEKLNKSLDGRYSEALKKLNEKNSPISKNCIINTSKWKVGKNISTGVTELQDETGNAVPSECVWEPLLPFLYRTIQRVINTKVFRINPYIGGILYTFFAAFEYGVKDYHKKCQEESKKENPDSIEGVPSVLNLKKEISCILVDLLIGAIGGSGNAQELLLNSDIGGYAFIDPRAILLSGTNSLKSLGSDLSFSGTEGDVTNNEEIKVPIEETVSEKSEEIDSLTKNIGDQIYKQAGNISYFAQYIYDSSGAAYVIRPINAILKLIWNIDDINIFYDVIFGTKGLSSARDKWDILDQKIDKLNAKLPDEQKINKKDFILSGLGDLLSNVVIPAVKSLVDVGLDLKEGAKYVATGSFKIANNFRCNYLPDSFGCPAKNAQDAINKNSNEIKTHSPKFMDIFNLLTMDQKSQLFKDNKNTYLIISSLIPDGIDTPEKAFEFFQNVIIQSSNVIDPEKHAYNKINGKISNKIISTNKISHSKGEIYFVN